MIKSLFNTLKDHVSPSQTRKYLHQIYEIDRAFTFTRFKKSSAFVSRTMKKHGSHSEVLEFPADGTTQAGDWTLPRAWDVKEAYLKVKIKGKWITIADRKINFTSLVMWCAPTPGGKEVRTSMVYVPDGDLKKSYRRKDVKGKIVYSETAGGGLFKGMAKEQGALALASSYNAHGDEHPDSVFWRNNWTEDPEGWVHKKRDAPFIGFSLSPNTGKLLKGAFKKSKSLPVKVRVNSKLYDGILPITMGKIQGKGPMLVNCIAHLMEQGANDNASGAAVMLEASRVLNQLIKKKILPKPKRSIRFVFVNEIYGTLAYAQKNIKEVSRTVAGLNPDCVGGDQNYSNSPNVLSTNPESNISFTDFVMKSCMKQLKKSRDHVWVMNSFALGDDCLSDPMIGIPTPYLGNIDSYWHTHQDDMSNISEKVLGESTLACVSYLYFLANAGKKEVLWLLESMKIEALSDAFQKMKEKKTALFAHKQNPSRQARRDFQNYVDYLRDRKKNYLLSLKNLLSSAEWKTLAGTFRAQQKQLDAALVDEGKLLLKNLTAARGSLKKLSPKMTAAKKIVPVRLIFGPPSYDNLPSALKIKHRISKWSPRLLCALFWCDGKRNLYEVIQQVKHEKGVEHEALLDIFKVLEKHHYLKFKSA